ncbi:hypothetical protein [Microbacterium capsulatum]|uniref:PepSY domain-containing protein n=1 Tax=Microbacterium capsulatum TaxID=3041921 RepID=A0ABU0XKB4_9MICO|nr:hypothetical protein [Microbacterium sp. ASV81]MDQ4215074.1 hypothetical protein [Microbacterium sp. ASV81]
MDANADPHVIAADLLPTPFSAAEIRDELRGGALFRIRVEAADGSVTERINRLIDGDDEGITTESWTADAEPTRRRSTWRELQEHAAFPAALARRSIEVLEHPLGRAELIRYDVADPDGDEVFWFSPAHPGMPVRYEISTADGVMRTTVVEITRDADRG